MASTHFIPPIAEHTHTIIFLHGRDSLAKEFAEKFFESQASDNKTLLEIFPGFKWVFPASGSRSSAGFDAEISQWFDVWSLENPEERKNIQIAGLSESIDSILDTIDHEAAVIAMDRIILAGISQGCATAIHALLRAKQKIGAFVGLSGWLPFAAEVEQIAKSTTTKAEKQRRICGQFKSRHLPGERLDSALDTPVLLTHCEDDEVVHIQNGKILLGGLVELGMSVEWRSYGQGGHWVNEPQGIDDVVAFLERFLRAGAKKEFVEISLQ